MCDSLALPHIHSCCSQLTEMLGDSSRFWRSSSADKSVLILDPTVYLAIVGPGGLHAPPVVVVAKSLSFPSFAFDPLRGKFVNPNMA